MGLLEFFKRPFSCFFGSPDFEENERGHEKEIDQDEIVGEILMSKDSASDRNWPPKKHKDPFIATMSEYWDMRIADLLAKKQEAMQQTARQLTTIKVKGAVEI